MTNRYSLPKKKHSRFQQTRYFYPMSLDTDTDNGGGGAGGENLDPDFEKRGSKVYDDSQVRTYYDEPYRPIVVLKLNCANCYQMKSYIIGMISAD